MANTYTYPVENIQEIRERFSEYFSFARYDAAYDLYSDLTRFIEEQNTKISANQQLLTDYQDVRAKAGWYIFDRLPAQQIVPLFEKHLQYFFDENWERRKEQLSIVCANIPVIASRDELKGMIRAAFETSNAPVGEALLNMNGSSMPPTMSNWIADFRQTFPSQDIADPLILTQYLNTAPNVQAASADVRKRIEGLLRFYMYVVTPSASVEGSDDIFYYHDVYTGTIHIFRDGHDIDTGEKSPIVASMTPEEIVIAKKQIEEESLRIGRIDIDAVNRGDLSTLREYLSDGTASPAAVAKAVADQGAAASDSGRRQNLQAAIQTAVAPPVAPRAAAPQESVPPTARPQVVRTQEPQQPIAALQPTVERSTAPVSAAPQLPVKPVIARSAPAPQPRVAPRPQAQVPPVAPSRAVQQQAVPVAPRQPVTVPAPPVPTKKVQRLKGVDTVTLAQQVLSDHGLLLDSAETEKRFISLIAAYAKGDQERKEVMQALVTPSDQGGINVTAGTASAILHTTDELIAFPERIRQRKSLQTQTEQTPRPTLAMVQELMQREKRFNEQTSASSEQVQSPAPTTGLVEDIFANLNTTSGSRARTEEKPQTMLSQNAPQSVPVAPGAPRQNIQPMFTPARSQSQQIMGPIDELKNLSLNEFRAYGANPLVATEALLQKVNILGQQSVAKRAEGIRAWQQSPVHQLYVSIGNSSLQSGVPVDQYILQQQQAGAIILSATEFDAISQLNRMLRY